MGLEPNHPSPIEAFALDGQDDAWLARLRDAENLPPLVHLGPYELLSEVGRGGQGVVYRARDRESRRTVAVKRLLSGSSASPHSRRRLDRELETAASLQHDGIVNVLGIHVADGQPLLAMEWISGVSITVWAAGDGARKSPHQVIDMMLEVCAAVQHAHQRGVIHRDLKPSNILVDAAGHPHILDFGLAKFAEAAPGEAGAAAMATELTIGEQFLGTLGYASPEQLGGRAYSVDVRSDLYQLGLILYELLTGRMPFPVASTASEALAQRETGDIARPSTFSRNINHDLDLIVMKSIAPDPTDRFQSAGALAADLAHCRAGEPIQARGQGTWYVARKLLRRHRIAVAFITLALALIVAGGTVATVLAVHLASAREREHQAREVAEQANAFLHDMLSSADPGRNGVGDVTAHELLDQAAGRLDQEFADQPLVKAGLHETIGRAYLGLGLYEQADHHLQAAVALHEGDAGECDGAGLAAALSGLGELRYAQRRLPEAEQFSRRALGVLESRLPQDEPAIAREFNNLGAIRRAQNDLDEAESLLRQALEIRRRLPGLHDDEIAETLNNLGFVLRQRGNIAGAESLCREVLAIRTARLGPIHPLIAQSLDNLGMVLNAQGRVDEALQFASQGLGMYRDVLGSDHPDVGISASNFGMMLFQAGRYEAAEPLLRDGLRIREAAFPDTDRRARALRIKLAECLLKLGRPLEAEPLLMKVLKQHETAGDELPNDLIALMIDFCHQTGNNDEALRYQAMLKIR